MIRQFFNDVMPVSYQFSTVLYEAIRSAPRFDRDLAWNGEYFAAELAGQPGGDERPERSGASTTTTPRARPASVRLRAGKLPASGGTPGGNCETRAPRRSIVRASSRSRGIDDLEARAQHGDRASAGLEGTAMRRRVDARARPLTIVTPRAARSKARRSAAASP